MGVKEWGREEGGRQRWEHGRVQSCEETSNKNPIPGCGLDGTSTTEHGQCSPVGHAFHHELAAKAGVA